MELLKLINHESIVHFKLFLWGDRYFKNCVGTEGRLEASSRSENTLQA